MPEQVQVLAGYQQGARLAPRSRAGSDYDRAQHPSQSNSSHASSASSFYLSSSSFSREGGHRGYSYRSSSSSRMGPGGIMEQQETVQDGRTGESAVRVSRYLDGKARATGFRLFACCGTEPVVAGLHQLHAQEHWDSAVVRQQGPRKLAFVTWPRTRDYVHISALPCCRVGPSRVGAVPMDRRQETMSCTTCGTWTQLSFMTSGQHGPDTICRHSSIFPRATFLSMQAPAAVDSPLHHMAGKLLMASSLLEAVRGPHGLCPCMFEQLLLTVVCE